MRKYTLFDILLTIIIAIVLFVLTLKLVFQTDAINEGKFRLTDAVVISNVEIVDKTDENYYWSLNVTQKNLLALLITPATNAKISRIYLSDITSNGNYPIAFYILNDETKLILNDEPQSLDVEYSIDENGQIVIEMVALNENVLKDWRVPDEVKEIKNDGRIFKTAGLSLEDLQFNLQLKLNIVETNGKINTLKLNVNMPTKYLIETGADVRRLDNTEFKFKVN